MLRVLHENRGRTADLRRLVGEIDSEEDLSCDGERELGHLPRDVQRFPGRSDLLPPAEHRRGRLAHRVEQRCEPFAVKCSLRDASVTQPGVALAQDRKSTRLNSSHLGISYAVFCLKKKKDKT